MSRILALKEKRAKVWEQAKQLLDKAEGEMMSADDLAKYENMESEIETMGREIAALERAEAFNAKMSTSTSTPIVGNPQQQSPEGKGRASAAYKTAFFDMVRAGRITNELTEGTDAQGGYLVPDEFERQIVDGLSEQNIFRGQLGARTITTTSGERKIPVAVTHGTATWMQEGGTYTDSADTFGQKTLEAFKLGTMIKVSEELLQDSAFPIDTYLTNEFARRLGTKEEEAFFIGDGSGKPTGIFNATDGAQTGITAASATAITFDEIIDLFYSLKSPYRRNAAWVMNDSTVKAIRKLKDKNDQYLWQPSLTAGQPDMLLNRPVYTSSYVPAIATKAKPVAFGDFSYYWIADRQGRSFKRLNERFADSGMIGFLANERVDGKLILPEAIKALVMA